MQHDMLSLPELDSPTWVHIELMKQDVSPYDFKLELNYMLKYLKALWLRLGKDLLHEYEKLPLTVGRRQNVKRSLRDEFKEGLCSFCGH